MQLWRKAVRPVSNPLNKPMSSELATGEAIRRRKTTKVLAAEPLHCGDPPADIPQLLELAGLAPFHRACDESQRRGAGMTGIEPWRFHVLDARQCRRLRLAIPLENAGKIPAMLAAADQLVMATWLPNPPADSTGGQSDQLFEPTVGNMEHIAAASAAIQNLLLAATAKGIDSYWSSGGVLRTNEVFGLLGIPTSQILLGAIFLFPAERPGAEVVGSKLRDRRSPVASWIRQVEIGSD